MTIRNIMEAASDGPYICKEMWIGGNWCVIDSTGWPIARHIREARAKAIVTALNLMPLLLAEHEAKAEFDRISKKYDSIDDMDCEGYGECEQAMKVLDKAHAAVEAKMKEIDHDNS